MGRDQRHWWAACALGAAYLFWGCTKAAEVACYDGHRCVQRAGQCSTGFQKLAGARCEELGYTLSCPGVWLKPPLSCGPVDAAVAGSDAGSALAPTDAAPLPATCAGRKPDEPAAPPPALSDAPCEFAFAALCGVGSDAGLIGTRSVTYPVCLAQSSEPPPKHCGVDGGACLLSDAIDTERCRPAELDSPDFNALVAMLCGPAPSGDDGLDAGAMMDASRGDAAVIEDAGGAVDACAAFLQNEKNLTGFSDADLASLQAVFCPDGGAQ